MEDEGSLERELPPNLRRLRRAISAREVVWREMYDACVMLDEGRFGCVCGMLMRLSRTQDRGEDSTYRHSRAA